MKIRRIILYATAILLCLGVTYGVYAADHVHDYKVYNYHQTYTSSNYYEYLVDFMCKDCDAKGSTYVICRRTGNNEFLYDGENHTPGFNISGSYKTDNTVFQTPTFSYRYVDNTRVKNEYGQIVFADDKDSFELESRDIDSSNESVLPGCYCLIVSLPDLNEVVNFDYVIKPNTISISKLSKSNTLS